MTRLPQTHDGRMRYWKTRRRVMRNLLREGWSLKRIGDKYGISKQAVWNCLNNGTPE